MEKSKRGDIMKKEIINIQKRIFIIRNKKVMLDSDLAFLYEVESKRLNEAVKRNIKRFPCDFMFRLTKKEFKEVVANCDHLQSIKFRSTMPYVFTEQGVAMLAAVLNSPKAININVQIMRAFVQLRNYVFSNDKLNNQLGDLRKILMLYMEKNDSRVNKIIAALNNLITKPVETKRIGFTADNS